MNLPHISIGSTIVTMVDTDKLHVTASEYETEFYQAYKTFIDHNDDRDWKKLIQVLQDHQNQLVLDDIPKASNVNIKYLSKFGRWE